MSNPPDQSILKRAAVCIAVLVLLAGLFVFVVSIVAPDGLGWIGPQHSNFTPAKPERYSP